MPTIWVWGWTDMSSGPGTVVDPIPQGRTAESPRVHHPEWERGFSRGGGKGCIEQRRGKTVIWNGVRLDTTISWLSASPSPTLPGSSLWRKDLGYNGKDRDYQGYTYLYHWNPFEKKQQQNIIFYLREGEACQEVMGTGVHYMISVASCAKTGKTNFCWKAE